MASIQGLAKIYGLLRYLFPQDFQYEFKQEMVDVFSANLADAAKTGTTLVVRACFFELCDLPVNLLVAHLSALRKGNIMETFSYKFSRSRAILMAALGMMVGWVLINLEGQFIHILIQPFPSLALDLLQMIVYSLPVVLCGLMLGVAAGVGGRRAFLRIVVWTAAGGILGHLVTFPIRMFNTALVAWAGTHPQWESVAFGMLPFLAVMCTYGFFNGAGLGFAFGGWQACKKFALIGLAAYSVGSLAGNYISLITPMLVYLGDYLPANITWSVIGALAGGILGWFFGKEKQPGPDTAIQTGNV